MAIVKPAFSFPEIPVKQVQRHALQALIDIHNNNFFLYYHLIIHANLSSYEKCLVCKKHQSLIQLHLFLLCIIVVINIFIVHGSSSEKEVIYTLVM